MRRITFDLDVLRTFVTGVDMGSFAKAADKLGRSTSAVSAQLKKLEEQLGMPVLRKEGRGMVTTPAGESLLGYARRLLELNDEAATAVRGAELAGSVRLGIQQDFGEQMLTEVLGRFSRVHPQVRIEARVARNVELMEQLNSGRLDLALAWDGGAGSPHCVDVGRLAMRWIGPADAARLALPGAGQDALPLVMMDAPCIMRSAATAALDRSGIAWRIAFTSPGLSSVWAAVSAGLGITVRTAAGLPPSLRVLDAPRLPPLPDVGLRLHRAAAELNAPAQRLHDIVLQALQPLVSIG
ncbi:MULTISPECIES: LysR substrate-binding domain-containing protein [unclassified Duganella]|uniref:LysR substrate-binding domain-containing protein n=1 Tax=unclassified Duganella TaxID=2636909 RepID=UPI00088E20BF|nr:MULTISPECIES: LysR substrate-binding domain-containing protein [unclassified Duganella]SDG16890.1 DNA-binding transcriptional regulator, LysR family [Duganella sp. OV458]SDJ31009.1 DNA-binding transcriptional regulator, LysR family [Duganella sp. OV510]